MFSCEVLNSAGNLLLNIYENAYNAENSDCFNVDKNSGIW